MAKYEVIARGIFVKEKGKIRELQLGEVITDRPINTTVGEFTYGMGITPTLIDEEQPYAEGGTFLSDYVPLLKP